ncbi:MAG: geranylgeranylglycerol-phosphate geranylgeranyltransferase [Candidatus Neomarinimicrobiota bacterium]
MKDIYNYFLLIRPLNVLVSGLAMIISAAILDNLGQELMVILIVLVVITYTAGANSINDVLDLEIDKVNRPSRPIPSKNVERNKALIFSFFLFLVGSVLSLQLPPNAYFISIVVSMPLIVIYSTHLKSKPLIGNIAVSFIIGLSFIFCGTVFENINPMWTPGLLAFSLTLIREITKDIADFEGDQIAKHNTYPIQHGIKGAIKLISFLSGVVCLVALVPYFSNTYNDWYLIILLIGVEIPLIIVVLLLVKNQTISSAILSSKILKFSTIMGLLAIYIGSL